MSKKKLPPDTIAESRSCPERRKSARGECQDHWKKRIAACVLPDSVIEAQTEGLRQQGWKMPAARE